MRRWLARGWDRVTASDPGLGRLRMALSAVVAMGTALAVEAAVARLIHANAQTALVSMLLGAMVAMMGSNALVGPEVWAKVRTAAVFPFAIGIGMALGLLTAPYDVLRVVGFVAVMFAAVFVRRFGPAWFFWGFMAWMGFFFASFLKPTPSMVPGLLLAVVVATAWVLLLSVTLFRANSRKVLHSTLRAFFARARLVAGECADLLETSDATSSRSGRRVRAQEALWARHAGLAEAALMVEAWSEDDAALPPGWSAAALRRRLIEAQQAVDRIAGASVRLVDADPALVAEARRVVGHLAHRRDRAASAAADRLRALSAEAEVAGTAGWLPARYLAFAAHELLDLDSRADDPPELDVGEDEFEATTRLVFGNLARLPGGRPGGGRPRFALEPVDAP